MSDFSFIADRLERRPIGWLQPFDRNPRVHDPEQVARIAGSIAEFGFVVPILADGCGNVIAGHGRLLAARQLGLAEVPVVLVDHLSETQRRAYIIADNQLTLASRWDDELLAGLLHELNSRDFDLDLLGFSVAQLDDLMAPLTDEDEPAAGGDGTEDEVPDPPAEPVSRVGDLWLLGAHRLSLCRQHRPGGGCAADGGRVGGSVLHQPALWQPARLHHRRHRRLGSPDAGRVRNPADDAGGTGADQPGVDPSRR